MTEFRITGSKILIVAESASKLGVLFDYLQGFGFRLLMIDEGESAISIATHMQPDIILMDVQLPDIDGFETCGRLKENEATQNIPVIFITAEANTVDKVRGFAVGAVDYITTPIQSEEVIVRLRTHLMVQHLQRMSDQQNDLLQAEVEEKEKLIKELDAFAHTVAHDLKNPLGVVVNYAKFLEKYGAQLSSEELQERLETMVRTGQKMNNIIDELLLLASVRQEAIETHLLEMGQIVEEALSRLAYMIEEYEAEITTPADWPPAWGYGPWVEEVITNFLSNAIKYGGRPPEIELGAAIEDKMARFWVKDNGAGLSPAEQAKLFVPFSRLNPSNVQGHGLGLSIVQRIMEKLEGTVAVESEGAPGQGSVFSFSLPVGPTPACKADA